VKLERKCELGGTDNGQGQIKFVSVHTFKATIKDCCIHYAVFFLKLKAACMSKSFACTAHIIIHLGCWFHCLLQEKMFFSSCSLQKMSSNWNVKNQGTSHEHEHYHMSSTIWMFPWISVSILCHLMYFDQLHTSANTLWITTWVTARSVTKMVTCTQSLVLCDEENVLLLCIETSNYLDQVYKNINDHIRCSLTAYL